MSNAFEVRTIAGAVDTEGGDGVKVDWKAINEHVVEAAKVETPENLIGIVSVIADMGIHEQEPAAYESFLTPEQEQKALDAWQAPFAGAERFWFETIKQEDGSTKRCKRWKVYTQEVAIAVDFPDIIVDKGQFFGDSKPLPLRLWLGGDVFEQGLRTMRTGGVKLSFNRERDSDSKEKTLHKLSTIRKMAVAAKVVTPDEMITQRTIGKVFGQLLGKALQFSIQVSFEKGKYYTENCKSPSALGRGQTAPECPTTPYILGLFAENEVEAVEHLPSKVLTRMRMGREWEASTLKTQVEALNGKPYPTLFESGEAKKVPKEEAKDKDAPFEEEAEANYPADQSDLGADGFDSDIPF